MGAQNYQKQNQNNEIWPVQTADKQFDGERSPALGVQETVGEDITSMLLEFSELEGRNGNGGNDVIIQS